jgi:hypothetical protein
MVRVCFGCAASLAWLRDQPPGSDSCRHFVSCSEGRNDRRRRQRSIRRVQPFGADFAYQAGEGAAIRLRRVFQRALNLRIDANECYLFEHG